MYNTCMLKWYLFRLLCCGRNDSGEICNDKVLNAVAHFAIKWCHSQPKTLTTRQGPPAGRMSVIPLADCPEKSGRTTRCSTKSRDLFRCGWLSALQQANKTPTTFLLTVLTEHTSVSSKNSSRTKPTSSEFVFLQLKPVELNIFQEFTSITKRSPLRWAWFWKTRAEGSRKCHKDHL